MTDDRFSPADLRRLAALPAGKDYTSREIMELERTRLWTKTWLILCREEELKKPGDFVTVDIGDESLLVVQAEEGPRGYHNICRHRGRRLKNGCGNTGKLIRCPFHGWRWGLEGDLQHVTDREDWDGDPNFREDRLGLATIRLESWGGWLWGNLDHEAEPLLEFLAPIPEYLAHHEFENCRRGWFQSVVFPCNWRLALDAFNEAYHVEATHPQLTRYGRPRSLSVPFGDHGWFGYPKYSSGATAAAPAAASAAAAPVIDQRKLLIEREEERDTWLHALISEYSLHAARRLLDELPETASYGECVARYLQLHREETERRGASWPAKLEPADIERAGTSWHIFPNTIFLPCIDGALWYRSRPNGDDPNSCIYDIWWLQRYAPGEEPQVEHEMFERLDDYVGRNPFLEQDFGHFPAVQRGVRSSAYKGPMMNPVQEASVANFHRALASHLFADRGEHRSAPSSSPI